MPGVALNPVTHPCFGHINHHQGLPAFALGNKC
jgi:hypothetical protein